MLAEEFERIAAAAAREGVRLEFIHGKLGVKAVPDGDHDEIIRWLTKYCMQHRPDLWLYPERGLRVETCRKGYAKPDGALTADGGFAGQGEWADPDQVLMVVEVTSYAGDTDKRDRGEKPSAYAQTGIPVYLLIDRDTCETLVYGEPEGGAYTKLVRRRFGKPVELPAPVGFSLDTEPLKDWVR
ncbi:Uma2 family endonuclease [Streptomyces alkaliterrae]|uniref:Uma2 family endonuclease n=1 Tax=Streptomyces alkaliterrae TaxID=2213162 RepID=A0A5P0YW09_9ACTN|nr:Uma2 family endonuclease [Streptomyces alkaliterrae]MBB1255760.1 Uma2 family endonuclease [Streptomyces alkaliterrae]MBB1258444.1 Uma2 family endonuclease [Streptomyces alkaliterrae]MQS04170.1 Uma2 family endonuclease [Streptomyces alkaliterrae]